MNDEEIVKFHLSDASVEPIDKIAETKTVHLILDYIDTSPSIEAAISYPLDQYGSITPWVAFQLGCYAELQADDGLIPQGLTTAYVSINAALRCRDSQRIFGNLLTLAGIYMRAHASDAAEQVYLQILKLPIIDGFLERAGVHLSLATILATKQPRASAEYYEQALSCLGERLPIEARSKTISNIIGAYKELEDWIGLAYVCELLKLGDVEMPLREMIQSGLSLPNVIEADTRLRRLGANQLADKLYSIWSEMHLPGGSHA